MLLTAKRSLLLLPDRPPVGPARNLALLRAAAERLGVPTVGGSSADWRRGLAGGRSQLVAAVWPGEAELQRLPPGSAAFLVIDCLGEDERPPERDWLQLAATPVTAEMVVFEWLERGATAEFRDLIALIK